MSQRITDGHTSELVFTANPNVRIWPMSVTPPGVSGGGPNDTTSLKNTSVRTRQPKKLKTMSSPTVTAQYDPIIIDQLNAMLLVNQLMYVKFPDGDKYYFWGWIESTNYDPLVEGSPPTVTIGIEPSNQDASGNEVLPYRVAA